VHKALSPISPMFSIAVAFGNAHRVYKSGNVVLSPHLLKGHQEYAKQQLKCAEEKVDLILWSQKIIILFFQPLFLVMHGGSGSSAEEIGEAVSNGVGKMNIDTDTQWAYWDRLRGFYKKNEGYLHG
jgi:fructose-bisphosphate aldolase class II